MLTSDEKLALLEAMNKKLKPMLEEAKGNAKLELMDMCRESGVDRKAIMIDGQKVGEIGITYSTAKPVIIPGMEKEAIEYLWENGMAEIVPKKGWEKCFVRAGNAVVNEESGEICPFMYWEPSVAKTAAVRGCKPEVVLEAIQQKLEGHSIVSLIDAPYM